MFGKFHVASKCWMRERPSLYFFRSATLQLLLKSSLCDIIKGRFDMSKARPLTPSSLNMWEKKQKSFTSGQTLKPSKEFIQLWKLQT